MRFTLVLTLFTLIGYAADANEDLLAAVRKGDLAAVKTLLDSGANVNAKSPYGATPLFFAADRGNIEMVKLLIDRGADVNVKDTFYGSTALTFAAEKERIEILKLLLAKVRPAPATFCKRCEKGNTKW
jgi:ankyrin repeat protein